MPFAFAPTPALDAAANPAGAAAEVLAPAANAGAAMAGVAVAVVAAAGVPAAGARGAAALAGTFSARNAANVGIVEYGPTVA